MVRRPRGQPVDRGAVFWHASPRGFLTKFREIKGGGRGLKLPRELIKLIPRGDRQEPRSENNTSRVVNPGAVDNRLR